MNYPNICNPQIETFSYEQPSNNVVSSTIGYAVSSRVDIAKPKKAKVTFIFTRQEYQIFIRWYFIDLKNGLRTFKTDWKGFEEVFFSEGSNMTITKNGYNIYTVSGLIIETTRNVNAIS